MLFVKPVRHPALVFNAVGILGGLVFSEIGENTHNIPRFAKNSADGVVPTALYLFLRIHNLVYLLYYSGEVRLVVA